MSRKLCLCTYDILTADDDDYEDAGGGNRLLGFMFGNVDNSGDLDADYLDEVILLLLVLVAFL